ncbi:MAG: hypothetical protein V1866_05985 [archaeon]
MRKISITRKAQVAFEYLATYGWAIMVALVAIGALAYFGFLNPTNLLPNKCDFGKQLECVEYRIISNGTFNIMFRNNFGKDITITNINGVDNTIPVKPPVLNIGTGSIKELSAAVSKTKLKGEKQEINLIVTFKRTGSYPEHNVTGTVFAIVQ